jgi:hypothetical protein
MAGTPARSLRKAAVRPPVILGSLILLQWAGTAAFALYGPAHNGWVYYQGGDQMWLTGSSWLLAHFQLPLSEVGYGWPYLSMPLAGFGGREYVNAMPAYIIGQGGLLLPLGTLLCYGVGERIGGRITGYATSGVWVASPFVSLLVFAEEYHDRWVDQFLPQTLGLTAMSDLPSTIILLAIAYCLARAFSSDSISNSVAEAVVAGLLAGFAIGIKPANALLLPGVALAFLIARRSRSALVFGLALAPSLVVLAVWKQRGLGRMPIFTQAEERLALTTNSLPVGGLDVHRYVDIRWSLLHKNLTDLDSVTWGTWLWIALPLIGAVWIARRRLPISALLLGWLLSFFVVKGGYFLSTVDSGSFFRFLMPTWAAYVPLVGGIVTSVAGLSTRCRRLLTPKSLRPPGWRSIGILAGFLVLFPLVLVGTARPPGDTSQFIVFDARLTAVLAGIEPTITRGDGGSVIVSAEPPEYPTAVFFRLHRSEGPEFTCTDTTPTYCRYQGTLIATGRSSSLTDPEPVPGATYRIGIGTNAFDDDTAGDVFVFTGPSRL